MSIPAAFDERVEAILAVIYLIFNEGYLAHGGDSDPVRIDLVVEAIRLTRVIRGLMPDRPEVGGLLALELFNLARMRTRIGHDGELVLLENQDRSLWDLPVIHEANDVLYESMRQMQPGPYQVQALIASHHSNAQTAAETDWPSITRLYRQLSEMTPSPVITLNHAVAVAMADGAPAGLALLDRLPSLEHYHLFHSARAELLVRSGRPEEALDAFATARSLTDNTAERRHLDRRIVQITATDAESSSG